MTAPPQRSFLTQLGQKPVVLGVLLVTVTLLLYAPVAHHGFLQLDDDRYVTTNDHVSTGLSLHNVGWAFTDLGTFYWHPLTWLSHMTDCQLFGLNPGAHHIVNLVLHIANVLLLFVLLRQATGAMWRSFVVAALFAVHPLNVETVAWVAERKSLLSVFFSFLTFAAYGWYVQRTSWKRYVVILGAFLLALMSKPMAVTVPLLLLMLDYWPLNRYEEMPFWRRWVRLSVEKAPLIIMSGASCAVTVIGQRMFGAMATLSRLPLEVRLQNAVTIYGAYLGKMIWPAGLAAFYPVPEPPLPWAPFVVSAIVLVGITAQVVRFRRARYAGMGWCLYIVALIPTIGLVQVGGVAMADRFTYIPGIGIFILVVWAVGDMVEAFSITQVVPAVASLCLVAACVGGGWYYLQFWQDGVTLFTRARTIAKQPNRLIEEGLADSLLAQGRANEALPHFEESCRLGPSFDLCHYNIAEIRFDRHEAREALEEYQLTLKLTGDRAIAVECLIRSGDALMTLGYASAAEEQYASAVRLNPGDERAQRRLRNISTN